MFSLETKNNYVLFPSTPIPAGNNSLRQDTIFTHSSWQNALNLWEI